MTKKDYILLAATIRPYIDTPAVAVVALELADALAADNPRFNQTTFLKACGVTL